MPPLPSRCRAIARSAASSAIIVLSGLAGTAASAEEPALSSPTALNGKIEASQELPGGGFAVVKLRDAEEPYFISANGRYVIRGAIYDLWAGRSLDGFEDIVASARKINLKGLEKVWPDLGPWVYGSGPRHVILFVDPKCPYCAKLLADLPALGDRFTFEILTVPFLGDESQRLVVEGHCAQDQAAAMDQLLTHRFASLPQRESCDRGVLQRRLLTAQILGIKGVPFLIRDDGTFAAGLPADVAGWLAAQVTP